MRQYKAHAETMFDENTALETRTKISEEKEKGYELEVNLKNPHKIKQKAEYFPFCPQFKYVNVSDFTDYMKTKCHINIHMLET